MKQAHLKIRWILDREIVSKDDIDGVYDAIYDHLDELEKILEILKQYRENPDQEITYLHRRANNGK